MIEVKKIAIPFASAGNKNVIYDTRQQGQEDNEATWSSGFPPVTMIRKEDGGLPPAGLDFNGIFHDISSNTAFVCMGGHYKFDKDYAAKISGYPKGAILLSDDDTKLYISNANNNSVNFNSADPDKLVSWSIIAIADIDKLLSGKVDSETFATALTGKADTSTSVKAGKGLTGGGNLSSDKTITLGTPSKITSTTKNDVTDNSHTHEIDKASIDAIGVVQLSDKVEDDNTKGLTPKGAKDYLDEALNPRSTYPSKQNRAWARFMKKLKVSGSAKINCVGTSNTSKNLGYISYPESLEAALNDVFRNNVTVTNMGISGGTVASNYNRWKDNTPAADLTIMEFTANDQARTEIGKFVDDLEKYIEYELDNDRAVLLITAPKTDTTININRDVYAAAMYGVANKYSIYILDTEKLFANYSMSIHYDGIHANSEGGTVLGYKIAAIFTGEGIHNPRTVTHGSTLLGRPTLDSLIFGPNTRQFQGSEQDPITPNEADIQKGVTANFAGQNGISYLYYAFYAESDNLYITPNIKLYGGVDVIFTLDGGTIAPKYSLSSGAAIDPEIKISKDNTYSYKNTSSQIVSSSSENNLIGSIPLVTAGWHLLKIEVKGNIGVLYGLEFHNAKINDLEKYGIGGRSKEVSLDYLFNAPETGLYYTRDTDDRYLSLTPENRTTAYALVEKFTDLYIKITWSYSTLTRKTYEIRKENGNWQKAIELYNSNNASISKDGFLRAQGSKEAVITDDLAIAMSKSKTQAVTPFLLDSELSKYEPKDVRKRVDVTKDRIKNVEYTNDTGMPIDIIMIVSTHSINTESTIELLVNNEVIGQSGFLLSGTAFISYELRMQIVGTVQPGEKYKFTASDGTATIEKFWEIRK